MADLGRGELSSWSQAQWDKLDALAKTHFESAAVFAGVYPPRLVPVDTPSVRIGAASKDLLEHASHEFTYEPGVDGESELEDEVINAAFDLALKEDLACVDVLTAAGNGANAGELNVKHFGAAETTFRTSGKLAGNLDLAVFVGHEVYSDLDSREFANTTARGHLETRFGTQLSRTVALDVSKHGTRAILTARHPKPLEIVRSDPPRVRVVKRAGRKITLQLVIYSAVGKSKLANVVLLTKALLSEEEKKGQELSHGMQQRARGVAERAVPEVAGGAETSEPLEVSPDLAGQEAGTNNGS